MSGLGCDRTHGHSGSAQIETNKFQSTLPEGSDRRHQQICGASLRRRVERPHHDTSQVVHLLKIPDFLQIPQLDSLVLLSLERFSTVVGCWSVPNVTIIYASMLKGLAVKARLCLDI